MAIGKDESATTADDALELTADLRTKIDPRSGEPMSGWYKKKIDRLGVTRYLGLASEARQNYKTTPQKYFTFLLNKY